MIDLRKPHSDSYAPESQVTPHPDAFDWEPTAQTWRYWAVRILVPLVLAIGAALLLSGCSNGTKYRVRNELTGTVEIHIMDAGYQSGDLVRVPNGMAPYYITVIDRVVDSTKQ